jgi:hypothetical protein
VLIGDLLRPLEEHVENAKAEQRKNALPVSEVSYMNDFGVADIPNHCLVFLYRSR